MTRPTGPPTEWSTEDGDAVLAEVERFAAAARASLEAGRFVEARGFVEYLKDAVDSADDVFGILAAGEVNEMVRES